MAVNRREFLCEAGSCGIESDQDELWEWSRDGGAAGMARDVMNFRNVISCGYSLAINRN